MESIKHKCSKRELKFLKKEIKKSLKNLKNKYFEGSNIQINIMKKGFNIELKIQGLNDTVFTNE